ncbi:hypothetical protein DASC09_022080 [Saccharomycopsis crataegensis]|uniref:BHLH domain-containing protein n=1 Tax=Saccharomycopsis crataegensis TaxID=43959 RepID=A0AAV5QJC5_9ASCO|nr:hypothetical protein DASC09_022080 [Saccharomycopsis crataegensis]
MPPFPAPPSFKSTIIQIKPNSKIPQISSSKQTGTPRPQRKAASKRKFTDDEEDDNKDINDDTNAHSKLTNGSKSTASNSSANKKKKDTKVSHSMIEKKRRVKLNREFEVLKILVPACRNSILNSNNNSNQINDGMYKLAILQASVEYINYLHEIIRLMYQKNQLQSQGNSHNKNIKNTDNMNFAKLSLCLENYRNLDYDFNFSEIMRIFKYMNSYGRLSITKRSKSSDSSNTISNSINLGSDNYQLISDEGFHKYLISKGIKQSEIDNFKLFFSIVDLQEENQPSTTNNGTPPRFNDHIFNGNENPPISNHSYQQSSFSNINFYSKSSSNKIDSLTWKRCSPQVSPATANYLNLPLQENSANSYNVNKEFQLPGPIMDLPTNNSTNIPNTNKSSLAYIQRQQMSRKHSSSFSSPIFSDSSNNPQSTTSENPSSHSSAGGNTSSTPNFSLPSPFKMQGFEVNNSLSIATQNSATAPNNISYSVSNGDLFSLSPNSFSSLLKTPKFENINKHSMSMAATGTTNGIDNEPLNKTKEAGEALLYMKRNSIDRNKSAVGGSVSSSTSNDIGLGVSSYGMGKRSSGGDDDKMRVSKISNILN